MPMIPKEKINDKLLLLIKNHPDTPVAKIVKMILPQVEISSEALRKRVELIKSKLPKDHPGLDEVDLTLLEILREEPTTLINLANELDLSPQKTEGRIKRLEELGYHVNLKKDTAELVKQATPKQFTELSIDNYVENKWHTFGIVSDTHLCSKYQRLDILNAIYDIFAEEGISDVYLPGNYVDGECRFNRFDLVVPAGIDSQFDYMLENYPQRDGITTYFIDGDDHEGWWYQREGLIPGKVLEWKAVAAERHDLKFLGYLEASVFYNAPKGKTELRLFHPKAGTAYAISYQPQKIIESLQGGEKPDILVIGHFHKAEHLPHYRNVHMIQAGTVCDQTRWMRGKHLEAHVGGWIVNFMQRPDGSVSRFSAEFLSFFDRGYHSLWEPKSARTV